LDEEREEEKSKKIKKIKEEELKSEEK